MRRRDGREKAGRGRSVSAVPGWAAGFASDVGVDLGGAVVAVALSAAGMRAWRLWRCEILDSFPAMAEAR